MDMTEKDVTALLVVRLDVDIIPQLEGLKMQKWWRIIKSGKEKEMRLPETRRELSERVKQDGYYFMMTRQRQSQQQQQG